MRQLYEQPVAQWPRPFIDSGVQWEPLGTLSTDSRYLQWANNDIVMLGKLLFFDPQLSSSNQTSVRIASFSDQSPLH